MMSEVGNGMTPNEAAICTELLQYPHILEADNVPRLANSQELCRANPSMMVFSVKVSTRNTPHRFWVEIPVSKNLVKDDHPNAKAAIVRGVLEAVAFYQENEREIKQP